MISFPQISNFAGPICFEYSERVGIFILGFIIVPAVTVLSILLFIFWLVVRHRKTQNNHRTAWIKAFILSVLCMLLFLASGLLVASDEIVNRGAGCGESIYTLGGSILSVLSFLSAVVAGISLGGYMFHFNNKLKK